MAHKSLGNDEKDLRIDVNTLGTVVVKAMPIAHLEHIWTNLGTDVPLGNGALEAL